MAFVLGSLEAYCWPYSAYPGGSVSFKIHSITPNVTITIYRIAYEDQVVQTYHLNNATRKSLPSSAYLTGCAWASDYAFTVPNTWSSGLYQAVISRDGYPEDDKSVWFVLKNLCPTAKIPTSKPCILVVAALTTYHAYNYSGGDSLYGLCDDTGLYHGEGTPTTNGGQYVGRASKVSLDRPFHHNLEDNGEPYVYESSFLQWADKNGVLTNFGIDWCTNVDLESDLTLSLSHYQLVITVGHDE
jgi:hypothetical protein